GMLPVLASRHPARRKNAGWKPARRDGHDGYLPQMGNTFGQLFRVTTFGESHGRGIGVVIDGCLPRIEISEADIQRELDRRRPGQSKLTTHRKEADRCEILSAFF